MNRRLARRGGIKRISSTVYEDIRDALRDRLRTIMQNITAIVESDPSNRKTVVVQDVIFTLNRVCIMYLYRILFANPSSLGLRFMDLMQTSTAKSGEGDAFSIRTARMER